MDSKWIKFWIIQAVFTIFCFIFAPGLKWKLLMPLGGAIGIYMALSGKSLNFHGRRR